MSAEAVAKIASKQNANWVSVTGRIDRFDVYEGKYYIEVIIPAADEYSNPGRVEVVSTRPLGSIGQLLTVDCSIRGVRPHFPHHQGTTGRSAGPGGQDLVCSRGGISADGSIQ